MALRRWANLDQLEIIENEMIDNDICVIAPNMKREFQI
jgi:hypothetical protein